MSLFATKEIESGGTVFHVQELSVRHRSEIFDIFNEDKDATKMSATIILYGCEEFRGKTIDDVIDLPGSVFDDLSNAVADVSGMNVDEEKKD